MVGDPPLPQPPSRKAHSPSLLHLYMVSAFGEPQLYGESPLVFSNKEET